MVHNARKQLSLLGFFPILLSFSIMMGAGVARAQETGGDLSGGAGIFRPKNPEAKRGANPSRPVARPTRPNPAEIEQKFEEALADGNDERDARKFAAAEASYRTALKLKPRDLLTLSLSPGGPPVYNRPTQLPLTGSAWR